MKIIKIRSSWLQTSDYMAVYSPFSQAAGAERKMPLSGVANPLGFKAESAFGKANKQGRRGGGRKKPTQNPEVCWERKWPGLSEGRQARISDGGSQSSRKDSPSETPGQGKPMDITHIRHLPPAARPASSDL